MERLITQWQKVVKRQAALWIKKIVKNKKCPQGWKNWC